MAKKSLATPRYKVRSSLRLLWMRSRERSLALKRSGYCCETCGIKQSKAKGREVAIEVHHVDKSMDWNNLIDLVYDKLLCSPNNLRVVCTDCHEKEHEKDENH